MVTNFRVVATLIYQIVLALDPNLPLVNPHLLSIHGNSKRMNSMIEGDEETGSWISSLTTWLMRSGADDIDAGIEQALLTDHQIFETMGDIHRFLFVKNMFANIQSTLDQWMTPLAVSLKNWIENVVRHVIETRYGGLDGGKISLDGLSTSPRLDAPVKILGPEAV